MADIATILLIPLAHTRQHGNLNGLSHEKEWAKSTKNLCSLSVRETYRFIPLSANSISLDSPLELVKWLTNHKRGKFLVLVFPQTKHAKHT
jgi:hypothetical protein